MMIRIDRKVPLHHLSRLGVLDMAMLLLANGPP